MRTYFIIEKEIEVVNSIKYVLEGLADSYCVGVADNYNDAINIILKDSPDLVFFNVDDIIKQPFRLIYELNQIKNNLPEFIAITSFKEKSFDIVKNGFFDILLKPLTDLEIRKTILKFQKKNPTQNKKKICLKSYKSFQYIDPDDILYLKADNKTTDFYLENGKIANSFKMLKTFEAILPSNFVRIHKSFIINKDQVSGIKFGKSTCTIKQSGDNVPFSKTYQGAIETMNQILSQYSIHTIN